MTKKELRERTNEGLMNLKSSLKRRIKEVIDEDYYGMAFEYLKILERIDSVLEERE